MILQVLTSHVGVVNNRFAPETVLLILAGAHSKLVRRVRLQVVDHCVGGGTCLVDPLPVPLTVTHGVEPETGGRKLLILHIIYSFIYHLQTHT